MAATKTKRTYNLTDPAGTVHTTTSVRDYSFVVWAKFPQENHWRMWHLSSREDLAQATKRQLHGTRFQVEQAIIEAIPAA